MLAALGRAELMERWAVSEVRSGRPGPSAWNSDDDEEDNEDGLGDVLSHVEGLSIAFLPHSFPRRDFLKAQSSSHPVRTSVVLHACSLSGCLSLSLTPTIG